MVSCGSQVRQLQEDNVSVKAERDTLQRQLQQELSENSHAEKEHQSRERDLATALQTAHEEHSKITDRLKQERKENVRDVTTAAVPEASWQKWFLISFLAWCRMRLCRKWKT